MLSSKDAPLVQRGDSMAQPCRGDCEADCIILLRSVAQRGSAVWVQRHAAGGSPSIPQSAFADSSLCTRAPSLPE